LAGHTQKATEEISKMINALLSSAEEAGKVMDHSVKMAINISSESASTAERLQSASIAVDDIAERAEQIASASNQQTVAAESIGSSIHEISDMSNQSTESVMQIASASEELSQLSIGLQDSVSQFKL
jgi:methyl-accepting chemotaxis protein